MLTFSKNKPHYLIPLNFLLITLIMTLIVVYYVLIKVGSTYVLYTDYGKIYQSEQFFLQGKSLYSPIFIIPKPLPEEPQKSKLYLFGGNLNTPFFNLLVLPLSLLNYANSLFAWTIISFASLFLAIILLRKALDLTDYPLTTQLALVLATLAYFPSYTNIQIGQVSLFLLPFFIAAWLAVRRNCWHHSAIFLAILTSIKPFFGLFILFFLLHQQWRVLAWFLVTLLICTVIGMSVFGWHSYYDYWQTLQHIRWYSSTWNVSLFGFFARIFGINEVNTPLYNLPQLTHFLFYFFSSITVILSIYFLRLPQTASLTAKYDLDFAVLTITMLLISPLAWLYYFPFLIVVFAILLTHALSSRHALTVLIITFAAIILTSLPFPLFSPFHVKTLSEIFLYGGSGFYGLIILFANTIFIYRTSKPTTNKLPLMPNYLFISLFIVALLPSFLSILRIGSQVADDPEKFTPKFIKVYFGEKPKEI